MQKINFLPSSPSCLGLLCNAYCTVNGLTCTYITSLLQKYVSLQRNLQGTHVLRQAAQAGAAGEEEAYGDKLWDKATILFAAQCNLFCDRFTGLFSFFLYVLVVEIC